MAGRRVTIHDAAVADNTGETEIQAGETFAVCQIKGDNSFAGVITFEGRIEGMADWIALASYDMNDYTNIATATTNPTEELWLVPIQGLDHFRANLSSYSAGDATVIVSFNHGAFSLG